MALLRVAAQKGEAEAGRGRGTSAQGSKSVDSERRNEMLASVLPKFPEPPGISEACAQMEVQHSTVYT